MSSYPLIITETSSDIISGSCTLIGSMIRECGIQPEDWPLMKEESPAIWARIEELEWLGPQELEETRASCDALIKNYERMIRRHVESKQRVAA